MIDLENAVLQLGDEVQNFKLQTHLKCDWNISSFCVIPHKYNQSAYTWDRLSKHLRGHTHNNLPLDTSQLQATISNMQNAHLQLLPETDLFKETEESLHKLNHMMWIKTLGGGLLDTIISGYKFLTLLCLGLRCMRKTIRELMKKEVAWTAYLLLQKQKAGIPNNVLSQP